MIEEKDQAGTLYADDVCLMANNEKDMQMIFDNISEYDMKVSDKSQRWLL